MTSLRGADALRSVRREDFRRSWFQPARLRPQSGYLALAKPLGTGARAAGVGTEPVALADLLKTNADLRGSDWQPEALETDSRFGTRRFWKASKLMEKK